jgi:hypothetical protein
VLAFLIQHQFWVAMVLYWIFSAAVSSMPDPGANTAPMYGWLFRFLHTVAGNISTAFASKIPGATKTLILLIALPLIVLNSACAAVHYSVHPGALNQIDSTTYDALLVAETTIDNARAGFEAGRLPESTKPAFNALVRSYNIARESWLTYRGAIATKVPDAAYFNQLNRNVTDLANALRAFRNPDTNTKEGR